MSDDNVLDQNEIERLLGGGGGSGPPPAPTPPPAADASGVMNQNELDALFGGGGLGTPPAPEPSSGPMDQSELDALFGGGGFGTPSTPAPSSGPMDQSDLDALFGGGGFGSPSTPAPAQNSGPMGQSDLDALFGAAASPPTMSRPSAPAFSPPIAPPITPPSSFTPPRPVSPVPAAPSFGSPPPFVGAMGMKGNAGGVGGGFGGGGFGAAADMDGGEDEDGVSRGDIDYLLRRADESLRSVATERMDLPTEVIEFQFPEFGGTVPSTEHATLDQISEVELDIKIELGRSNMYLEDVLKLRKGSVVPLDKMAGDAVDIYVNGRLLARGEVLVMNENFCVRVAELLAGAIPME